MEIEDLSWDTNFFGFKVGRIPAGAQQFSADRVYQTMKQQALGLVYLSSHAERPDLRDQYIVSQVLLSIAPAIAVKKTSPTGLELRSLPVGPPPPSLFQMALEAGWSSRFRLDDRISEDQFRDIYRIWIERSCLREMADEVYVVLDDTQIAGFVTIVRQSTDFQIGLISVSTAYRRRGIGRKLLDAAAQYALSSGASSLSVITQRNNEAALRLYQSMGFRTEQTAHWYHFWADQS